MPQKGPRRTLAYYTTRPWFWGSTMSGEGGWVYMVQDVDAPLIKIGFTRATTVQPLTSRLRALSYEHHQPMPLLLAVRLSSWARQVERRLHWVFRYERIHKEWFYLQSPLAHLRHAMDAAIATIAAHPEGAGDPCRVIAWLRPLRP